MQYKRLQKSNWWQQNPSRRFGDILEFLKIDFLPQNAYFSNNKIFSSFIEYTLLWDVQAKLLIQYEGLRIKSLIKIRNDPPKGDFCHFSFL